MKKAKEALKSKDPEQKEAVQEIDEEQMRKEQLKKGRVERQARRVREREEEEQQTAQVETAVTGMKGGRKLKKDKKDCGSKRKPEQAEIEEEREGVVAKKVCGCINPQEAEGFQNFVKSKMEEIVDEMKSMKDLINPVRKFIRALKVEYDVIGLFESNGVANMEDSKHHPGHERNSMAKSSRWKRDDRWG